MTVDRVESHFGPGQQLQIPQMKSPYPGLSLDLVNVAGGPQGSLLATWTDAVERREFVPLPRGQVTVSDRTRLHLEVVTQYAPTGEISAQWEIWTDEAMLEYRVLTGRRLLGFARESVEGDNVLIFGADGTKIRSDRLNPGITDVGILSNDAILIAYDRYFEDDQGVVLGLAMYNPALERTDFGDGAGYLPSTLTIVENDVTFWDRSSSLIISSERGRPIWPDLSRLTFDHIGPEWVLHVRGTNRWALAEKSSSGSIVIVLGYVDSVHWTTAGVLVIRQPDRFAHQGTLAFCHTDTLNWCAGRQWYTMSLEEMFADFLAESEPVADSLASHPEKPSSSRRTATQVRNAELDRVSISVCPRII